MISRFRVVNFKSLLDVQFRPHGLNIVVGANNSGKTTLCQALRFLSLTATQPLDAAAQLAIVEKWNLFNLYSKSQTCQLNIDCVLMVDGQEIEFSYALEFSKKKYPVQPEDGHELAVDSESLTATGGGFHQTLLLDNRAGRVRLLHERKFLHSVQQPSIDESQIRIETHAPTQATMLSRLYDLHTNQAANQFKRYLISWCYYSLVTSDLRSNVAKRMDSILDPTGSNLASVLHTLHSQRPREMQNLVQIMRHIEPRLDQISFLSPDPDHVYMFFEDSQNNRFGPDSISDGSLRFLALSFIVETYRRDSAVLGGPRVLLIEEPENGVYVGHLKPLVARIDASGSGGQYVFTSHSPYFIDLFDAVPGGVHVMRKSETQVVLSVPDEQLLAKRLQDLSLGELHFRGLLQ